MSSLHFRTKAGAVALALLGASFAGTVLAIEPPEPRSELERKVFFLPELKLTSAHRPAEEVLDRLPNRGAWQAFLAGGRGRRGTVDPRSGAASSLVESTPLVPGRGVGNRLDTGELSRRLGRPVGEVDARTVGEAVRAAVAERRALLGIELAQLAPPKVERVTPDLWQISMQQVYRGVPVRHGRLVATVGHGNLILLGTETWGDVRGLSTRPVLAAADALAVAADFLGGGRDCTLRAPALEILPTAPPEQAGEVFDGAVGTGYRHRLVWSWTFQRPPSSAAWEVLVDAHDGTLLAFHDRNEYVTRSITGGVYPLTSTGICPTAGTCGTMQDGWPMPFADTGLPAPDDFTGSAGLFQSPGEATVTRLDGRYVRIVDACGAIANGVSTGSISLGGENGQHDCVSGGGSPGNTPAARAAFYEVNKLAEQARGWLPANAWLSEQLTANVNLGDVCNAFWNGSTINFYRSGGGCGNTGELAGVLDHEWGHGLDYNDAAAVPSNPSEAYADVASIYRLQDSCLGHGFFRTFSQGCGMTSDGTGFNTDESQIGPLHCDTDCSGVRDADWGRHADETPDTALGFVCGSCVSGFAPCGRQVHCAAAPVRQAAWDLVARDLQAPPFEYDSQTAFLVGNKLFYQGSGNVGEWYACSCGSSSSGCGATNGYMQWLAADDDNGDLSDGTPHMTAIHAAFDRHGIACSAPAPQNGGCAADPTAAPGLAAVAGELSAELSWDTVPGASRYWVFRTEGHAGCELGKTRIAETTATSFVDGEVANGRQYHYNVAAVGGSSACFGPLSTCVSVTPLDPPGEADFTVSCRPSSLAVVRGTSVHTACEVASIDGFAAEVTLSCAGLPAGISCSPSPPSTTVPADGSAPVALTVAAGEDAPLGDLAFDLLAVGDGRQREAALALQVLPAGSLQAAFDPTYQAPVCSPVGARCDSGPALLLGRDNLAGGSEPNQPNTLFDSCFDGGLGAFHHDESSDRLVVATLDGGDFVPGTTVRVEATVWVWPGIPTQDQLDLYYAADAASPSWQLLTSIRPTADQGGARKYVATYPLPVGGVQAVRSHFRWLGSNPACTATGGYNDHDDLAFAVCADCGCVEHLSLSGQTIASVQTFAAEQSIVAGELVVAAAGDLALRAGGTVTLGDGFAVAAGGRLRVETGSPAPCP